MGTMGLALPWKTKITSALREPAAVGRWEKRVGPSEHLTGGPAQAGRNRQTKMPQWPRRAGRETCARTSGCTRCTARG